MRGEPATSEARSVLDGLTSTQLAGFVLFGEVETYPRGAAIVREGTTEDAFRVLLAGHLSVSTAGRATGEVAEGEGFGEAALLEGGRCPGTITVLSADADVLAVRREAFQDMVATVPAFAWDIWETGRPRG